MTDEIQALEQEIWQLSEKLHKLKRAAPATPVPDYVFQTQHGDVRLSELFGDRDHLLLIHNMGQACRYCTLWADGFNGVLDHLESAMSVVLVSKDDPATQRQFANSRGWRFRLASHGGGAYLSEQNAMPGADGNMPGAVAYRRDGDQILRANACAFGPGDLYNSTWHLLALAGIDEARWQPQYRYWQPPAVLEDGNENRVE